MNLNTEPLLWIIDQKSPNSYPGAPIFTSYVTKFIVLPKGNIGVNTCNPRSTFDVVQFSSEFKVFPNPTSENLILSITDDRVEIEDIDIIIYDTNGKIVKTINSVSLPLEINLAGINKGLYLIKLSKLDVVLKTIKFVVD